MRHASYVLRPRWFRTLHERRPLGVTMVLSFCCPLPKVLLHHGCSVVTVFTASGRALTARVYPDAGSLGVWLVGGGVFNVTAWSLAGTALEASGV